MSRAAAVGRQRGYRETIRHYNELREAVYIFVEKRFQSQGIKACEVSHLDACAADKWVGEGGNTSWQWQQMYADYHTHAGIKRFDLAIKLHGILQLLCYGVPSRRKLILKLHAIERSPTEYRLADNAVSIALFAAFAYAELIESKEIWLCNPLSPAHVRLYQAHGFTARPDALGRIPYLTMRLDKYGR